MLTPYRTSFTVVLAIVVAVGVTASRLTAQGALNGWTTRQNTHTLVLTKVEAGPAGSAIVSLTNVSEQVITAIAISSPPNTVTLRHF